MTLVLLALVAIVGLAIGSFLNVVIWRVPRGESVAHPPSACPSCAARIGPRDNVPVVSWLLLRGRCRRCLARISARYPLVELGTGVLFVILAVRFGFDPVLPAYLYLGAVGVALALIDLDTRKLPNALVLPSYPIAAVLLGGAALLGSESGSLLRAALGGAAMYAFYFALVFAYPKGMGFGDVKLAGVLGLYTGWLGWGIWAVGLFAGFLLGGVLSIGLLLAKRGGRKTQIPYGPSLLLGVLLAVLVGERVFQGYLDVSGL